MSGLGLMSPVPADPQRSMTGHLEVKETRHVHSVTSKEL